MKQSPFWLACGVALSFWLGVGSAEAAGARVDRATVEQKRLAQKTFEAADELYEAGRFEEALSAFRGSYEIVASPNSLLMVARSLRELGHLVEADEVFVATLALAENGAGRYAETARAVRTELAALRTSLGSVELDVSQLPSGASVAVAGLQRSVEALAQPLRVAPGKVPVTVTTRDGQVSEQVLEVSAGATVRVPLTAGETPQSALGHTPPSQAQGGSNEPAGLAQEPPAPPGPSGHAPPLRSAAFVAGGVGAAGLLAFAAFGALDNSTFHGLESDCSSASCAPSQRAAIDRGRRYQLWANVGLGTAAVGLAACTTLYVLSLHEKHEVTAAVGPQQIVIGGKF